MSEQHLQVKGQLGPNGSGEDVKIELVNLNKENVAKFKIKGGLFDKILYTVDLGTMKITKHPVQGTTLDMDLDVISLPLYESRVKTLFESLVSQDMIYRLQEQVLLNRERHKESE